MQWKIVGIGVLKGVLMKLCGMECMDLTKNSMKILVVYFLILRKVKIKRTLLSLLKIEKVPKIQRAINLTGQGNINLFKF